MNLLSRHHFSPGLDVLSVFCPSPEPAEEEGEFGINAMRGRLRLHCLNIEFTVWFSGLGRVALAEAFKILALPRRGGLIHADTFWWILQSVQRPPRIYPKI